MCMDYRFFGIRVPLEFLGQNLIQCEVASFVERRRPGRQFAIDVKRKPVGLAHQLRWFQCQMDLCVEVISLLRRHCHRGQVKE